MIQTSLLTFTIRSRIKISPTSTGQKKAVSMNFLTLSSRLATARRDLASNSDKKPKKRRTFAKKNRLKNREIRKNRINLLLFTFENRRKIKEKSALFGGPYRNSDRQFFILPQVKSFLKVCLCVCVCLRVCLSVCVCYFTPSLECVLESVKGCI